MASLVPQELELFPHGLLGILYRAHPVGGVNLVEVPLEHLRYRTLAPLSIPQQGLRRAHRLHEYVHVHVARDKNKTRRGFRAAGPTVRYVLLVFVTNYQ